MLRDKIINPTFKSRFCGAEGFERRMQLPASKAAGAHLPLLGQGLFQVLDLRLRSLHFCLELLTGLWDRRRETPKFL